MMKWDHVYQPETKWNSMQWTHPSPPVANKFKPRPQTNFWDSQGPILETYLEFATTATSATYFDVVQRVPKLAIHSRRRGKTSEGIPLLHDNACPCLCVGNPQEIKMGSHGPSNSQPRFGAI
jgi:hypothetical protein